MSGGDLWLDDFALLAAAVSLWAARWPRGLLVERPDVDVDAEPVLDVGDAAAALADDRGDVVVFDVDDGFVLALEAAFDEGREPQFQDR